MQKSDWRIGNPINKKPLSLQSLTVWFYRTVECLKAALQKVNGSMANSAAPDETAPEGAV